MPNLCDYSIKIKGTKENCYKFLDKMTDYDEPNHFWRIFDAIDSAEEGTEDDFEMRIYGDCAWSLESCCRASGYSNGIDLFAVNTKDLDLELEAWSREPGIGFEEHYIYNKGECAVDECKHIDVFWWDKTEYQTYEDFKEEYPDAPDEELFTEDNYNEVYTGGFGSKFEKWNI